MRKFDSLSLQPENGIFFTQNELHSALKLLMMWNITIQKCSIDF